jgi:hypothetical protein
MVGGSVVPNRDGCAIELCCFAAAGRLVIYFIKSLAALAIQRMAA